MMISEGDNMERKKYYGGVLICAILFVYLWFSYNGLLNAALYSMHETISMSVYWNSCFVLSPATGIGFALGTLSLLEILWLVPEEVRQRNYHLALWIIITFLGNSFIAYLISRRSGSPVEINVWMILTSTTIINIGWYFLLFWSLSMRKIIQTGEDDRVKAANEEAAVPVATKYFVTDVLKRINCEPKEDKRGILYFDYQAESFLAIAKQESVFVTISNVCWYRLPTSCDVEEFARLQKVINETNKDEVYSVFYTIDKESNEILLHTKRNDIFIPQIPNIEDYLISILNGFFRIQRFVHVELERRKVSEGQL